MDAEQLFKEALSKVESASIREWAESAHNRPIFVELAGIAIAKKGPSSDPTMFSAFIVSKAIGLV